MVENTLAMFTAYRNGKGVAELHVFQMGAHGFVNKGGGADLFMDRLEEWLRANKVLASKWPEQQRRFTCEVSHSRNSAERPS